MSKMGHVIGLCNLMLVAQTVAEAIETPYGRHPPHPGRRSAPFECRLPRTIQQPTEPTVGHDDRSYCSKRLIGTAGVLQIGVDEKLVDGRRFPDQPLLAGVAQDR